MEFQCMMCYELADCKAYRINNPKYQEVFSPSFNLLLCDICSILAERLLKRMLPARPEPKLMNIPDPQSPEEFWTDMNINLNRKLVEMGIDPFLPEA
jgi:hypothetical protein